MSSGNYSYFLRFFLTGVKEPLVFNVDKETYERVGRNLEGNPRSFCWFSTIDRRDIAIALDSIDLVNLLWEPVGRPTPSLVEDAENKVRIHFRGRSEPYEASVEEAWEVFDFFWYLEMGSYDGEPFLSFTDEDGERVVVDARKVFLVEAPTSLLAQGRREVAEQDEGAESSTTAKKLTKQSRSRKRQKKAER